MIRIDKQQQLVIAMLAGPLAWFAFQQLGLLPAALAGWALWRFVLVQPVIEELVFRGAMQQWLLKRVPQQLGFLSWANIITAVVFTLAHFVYHPPLWALAVFVPALLFGYFRDRYDHVWPALLLHTWYNAGFFLLPVLL
ncbi:MAG: JDVT-CTERM system glutamic-type intramembrane protease [Gammaproteobacteria bacterium]|nr:JDVT-CTERM system glutamic-type intramembrane protease [Gammaproteobacteria bacterium]